MKKNLIITLLVLGLCGYLVYNKIFDKKETDDKKESITKNDNKQQGILLNEKSKDLYAFKNDNN